MGSNDSFSGQVRQCAERIAESGGAALSGLYDLAAQRLLRFAVTITRNQHDAEDALQAVLVRVAAEPRYLLAAEHAWPYLLRMVRNESLLILRRKKRANISCSSLGLSDLISARTVDEVAKEDTHRAVWAALRKLPSEQSEIVVLKIWEQTTFAQAAEILEITPSTAASRYRYAMTKLAQLLRDEKSEVSYE